MSISPGPIVDTGSFDGAPEQMKAYLTNQIPLGRMGLSKEIAGAALFYASDDSSFVTGTELAVDGGMNQV